jgi:hypothetical protein
MPLAIGLLVVVAVAVGVYFAFPGLFKGITDVVQGPMTAAEYKTQALKYADAMNATDGPSSDVGAQLTSTDPAERATAKAAWDKLLADTRASMAAMRALRPPTEYQSIHDRLMKGVAAADKLLVVLDNLVQKIASGAITQDNMEASPEYAALLAIGNDTTLATDTEAYTAALEELRAK